MTMMTMMTMISKIDAQLGYLFFLNRKKYLPADLKITV